MNRSIRLALVLSAFALLFCADAAQAQYRGRGGYGGGYGAGYGGRYYGGGYGAGYGGRYYGSYRPYYGGYGYYPRVYGGIYVAPNYGYSGGYYSSQPYYSGSVIYTTPAAPPTINQAMYVDPTSSVGRIRVAVPTADARLVINGAATTQTGTNRLYETPALQPGATYSYNLQATWMQNGREVVRNQDVQVKPGQVTVVTFNDDPPKAMPQK